MLIPPILDRYCSSYRLQDHYEFARKVWTLYRHDYIEWNIRVITPFAHHILCQEWHDLQKWLSWVNRNIVIQLGLDARETTLVKMRIATGMLNNIKTIDEIHKIEIHSNFVRNLHYEMNIINTEDLPF